MEKSRYKDMSKEELEQLLEKAQQQDDYENQIELCRALLPYQDRPCLALTAIKELEALAGESKQKKS